MKKSLIALAVLAASGASFAQSTVTLYGTVDEAFAHVTGTNSSSQNVLVSGGVSTSNFGFKGSEDLGGGLKANFKLEQGFNVDSGSVGSPSVPVSGAAATTPAFGRYAYVGFSGGFGEVKLGVTGTPYDDIQGAADVAWNSNALGLINTVFLSSLENWNPANTIYYATPSFSGFSGALSYSLGENKTAAVDAGSIISMNAKYEGGPLFVGFAYQTQKTTDAVDALNFTRLNATYDLKVTKLLASYGRVTQNDATTNEYEIGAEFPISAAMVISGGIARSSDNTAAGDAVRKGYTLAGIYSLSKRTTAYAGYTSKTTTLSNNDTDASVLAIGVKHTF